MGYESANFYRNQIEQLSELVKDLSNYVNDADTKQTVEEVLQQYGYE